MPHRVRPETDKSGIRITGEYLYAIRIWVFSAVDENWI
jgi:hypothetical protein